MRKIYTSIEIANDTIRILVCEYFLNKYRVLAVSSVKSKGIKNGEIIDDQALRQRINIAIEDIKNRIDVTIKKVILIVPPINCEYNLAHGNIPIISDDKTVTYKDMVKVINCVTKEIVPNMELINVMPIDFSIYENGSLIETTKNPVDKMCDRLSVRAMLITSPKTQIIPYLKLAESCNLEVVDLALSPICDYEEIKNDDLSSKITAVINIGKEQMNLSIFNKGIITNSATIKKGSKIIDDDISYVYNLSRKTAKKIKENFSVAHMKFASKNDTYEVLDTNDKIVSINQYEVSKIVNKRLVELLNISKNELKVLTNKQISYIMVLGGITDIPAFKDVILDVYGTNADTYSLNILGIRKSRYITLIGAIKYFVEKINLRKKQYSMFSSDDVYNMTHIKNKNNKSDSVFGKILGYFFDN